ncbi:hypothetical protein V8F06_013621 [Rhypophila decipiens]
MKDAFLAILGAVGLISAAPVPAGGFYPGPNFPGMGGGGTAYPPCLGIPAALCTGNSGVPLAFGGDSNIPQMCNCNNPSTKETIVEPFYTESGGRAEYRVFSGVEPIKQHMCILSKGLSGEVFTNAKCRKQFGEDYNSFCSNAT